MVINIVNGLRRWIHVPLAALACLTRGRGDDRVVCLARNSPIATTLYIHTPLALFRVTHSCGNVSIVTSWALYGQQLGAGIWAEACADTSLCVLVSGSSALESAHLELQALTLIWSKLNDRRGEEQVDRKEGEKHRQWNERYTIIRASSFFFLTVTFSSSVECVCCRQTQWFVMSDSPSAAIQQKVKGSVGKGSCTKPSLPPSASVWAA